jgi:Spy/CpxP family protein refolding chaperone
MKPTVRVIVGAVALALVSATAMAQTQDVQRDQGRGARGTFGATQTLLRSDAILKELEVAEDQKQQITKILDEARESFQSLRAQNLSTEEFRAKATEAGKKTQERIHEVLQSKQKDRLAELMVQFQGASALTQNSTVAEKLNLMQEQKDKLANVLGRSSREAQPLSREERIREALEVLTTEQKEQFEKMQGKRCEAVERLRATIGERGRESASGRGKGEGRAPSDR